MIGTKNSTRRNTVGDASMEDGDSAANIFQSPVVAKLLAPVEVVDRPPRTMGATRGTRFWSKSTPFQNVAFRNGLIFARWFWLELVFYSDELPCSSWWTLISVVPVCTHCPSSISGVVWHH